MHSLISALDGVEWQASRHGRFTSGEEPPSTYWIGVWVGPKTGLDMVSEEKIPSPLRKSLANLWHICHIPDMNSNFVQP